MTTQPETKPGEETGPRSAPYELAHAPDGRSWTVRENLTAIIERELLGPANGPNELLKAQPDIAYLVGRIAPVRLKGDGDDPSEVERRPPPLTSVTRRTPRRAEVFRSPQSRTALPTSTRTTSRTPRRSAA